jgi:hypothetical protein
MSVIEDGTGTGNTLQITSGNRASTFAVTEAQELFRTSQGDSFNIETPVIPLTSDNKSGVLYIENNDDIDLVITSFFNLIGDTTGGSGNMLIEFEFNTVGGTLVSTANVVTPVNKLTGSTKELDATVFYGAEGLTVDSGLKKITSLSNFTGRNILPLTIILPKGNNVSVSITPFTSNTNMDIIAAVDCYLLKAL